MIFRPFAGLTIACAILFAILCGLGVWQLERLQWKLDLIARVNSHMTAPPVPLGRLLVMGPNESQYRRVTLQGRFDHAKEAYVFTTDAGGAPYCIASGVKAFFSAEGEAALAAEIRDWAIQPRTANKASTRHKLRFIRFPPHIRSRTGARQYHYCT